MFRELLKSIARELDKAGIPYMVIGGQAVLVYGEPRLTRDIDITLGAGVDQIEKVKGVVRSLGMRLLKDDDEFVRKTMVLPARNDQNGIRIDLIFSFSPYERQAIEHARTISFDDVDVRFASLEDVVIHKVIAGRPRDIEDVRVILLKNPSFDDDYISSWLAQFDTSLDGQYLKTYRGIVSSIKHP